MALQFICHTSSCDQTFILFSFFFFLHLSELPYCRVAARVKEEEHMRSGSNVAINILTGNLASAPHHVPSNSRSDRQQEGNK